MSLLERVGTPYPCRFSWWAFGIYIYDFLSVREEGKSSRSPEEDFLEGSKGHTHKGHRETSESVVRGQEIQLECREWGFKRWGMFCRTLKEYLNQRGT